jgi:hypothetical protein
MDFETSSLLAREATISIAGLEPIAGQTRRNVYISVQTANMPSELKEAAELPRDAMARARVADASALVGANPRDAGAYDAGRHDNAADDNDAGVDNPDGGQAPAPHQTSFERIASVWPTYQVHAYYEVSRGQDENGVEHVRLADSVPFGYFVDHEGKLWGWDHAISGLDGAELERIAPDYYHVKIPNDGSIDIMTWVLAKESKGQTVADSCDDPRCPNHRDDHDDDDGDHTVTCSCQLLGASSTAPLGIAALLPLLIGLVFWLRRR